MDYGFEYFRDNGICTESSYPYTAQDGTCVASSCTKDSFTISGYTDVTSGSTSSLKAACDKQPVSIAVDAENWSSYSSGIYSNCGTSLDHGVLLAGYTDSYWLVKNSWGASWGENGYIRFVRGKDQCGLADQAVYATGAKMVGPVPGPSPGPSPSPGGSHYEQPPCQSDEQKVRVEDVPGDFCAPDCTINDCPTDVPAGVTAQPQCVLQSTGGTKSCALICDPSDTSECGAGSCHPIQGMGICTYAASNGASSKVVTFRTTDSSIVV